MFFLHHRPGKGKCLPVEMEYGNALRSEGDNTRRASFQTRCDAMVTRPGRVETRRLLALLIVGAVVGNQRPEKEGRWQRQLGDQMANRHNQPWSVVRLNPLQRPLDILAIEHQ